MTAVGVLTLTESHGATIPMHLERAGGNAEDRPRQSREDVRKAETRMTPGTPIKNTPFGPNWYGEQNEDGVDLSLIRENLKLTPLERIRKGDLARRQALRLMEYGRIARQDPARNDR
ncbi:MAG: hypothetical protein GY778_00785 [bacterium]|nr:hypothetical protein [bacterium]